MIKHIILWGSSVYKLKLYVNFKNNKKIINLIHKCLRLFLIDHFSFQVFDIVEF